MVKQRRSHQLECQSWIYFPVLHSRGGDLEGEEDEEQNSQSRRSGVLACFMWLILLSFLRCAKISKKKAKRGEVIYLYPSCPSLFRKR